MSELMYTRTDIFKKSSNDEGFKKRYEEFIFDMLWSHKGRSGTADRMS